MADLRWTEEQLAEHYQKLGLCPTDALAVARGAAPEPASPVSESPMSESLIEAECTKLLEEDGWRALRTDPVSDRSRGKGFGELGMADHLYIRYTPFYRQSPDGHYMSAGHILWIEFKSPKGKPKKHQIHWHQKERARGALTWIASVDFPASVEGFRKHYRASGLMRRVDAQPEVRA